MKKLLTALTLLAFVFTTTISNASLERPVSKQVSKDEISTTKASKEMSSNAKAFLKLSPKKYAELTGKKLTLKQIFQLKAAQKALKKEMKNDGGERFDSALYIILAIFGWAWLLMGISDNWTGSKWIVNLVLTLLCWLPGVIHSFVHMKEYTK